jgi:hypothetical protein
VAQLVARGMTNRQIAQELVIAASTVERHVANILRKLDIRSRSQLAVWSVHHNTTGPTDMWTRSARFASALSHRESSSETPVFVRQLQPRDCSAGGNSHAYAN